MRSWTNPIPWIVTLALLALPVVSMGCSSTDAPVEEDLNVGPQKFSADIQPIFGKQCALSTSCHQASNDNNLNLDDAATSYAALVNKPYSEDTSLTLVVPNSPDKSFLINKLEGNFKGLTCEVKGCGDPMPPTGGIPKRTVAQLRRWIADGAKND
jgi:hypothetical protein